MPSPTSPSPPNPSTPITGDVLSASFSLSLASSTRLIQSWLPPPSASDLARAQKTDEQLHKEDEEAFRVVPERYVQLYTSLFGLLGLTEGFYRLGLGAPVPKDGDGYGDGVEGGKWSTGRAREEERLLRKRVLGREMARLSGGQKGQQGQQGQQGRKGLLHQHPHLHSSTTRNGNGVAEGQGQGQRHGHVPSKPRRRDEGAGNGGGEYMDGDMDGDGDEEESRSSMVRGARKRERERERERGGQRMPIPVRGRGDGDGSEDDGEGEGEGDEMRESECYGRAGKRRAATSYLDEVLAGRAQKKRKKKRRKKEV
ncbi:MAG: hypothetical protein Q9160_006545 [Pyrenula sp. 1 TL-2023]